MKVQVTNSKAEKLHRVKMRFIKSFKYKHKLRHTRTEANFINRICDIPAKSTIALVLFASLLILNLPSQCSAYCPAKCHCNDLLLEANCTQANPSLTIVPLTLNPLLTKLTLNNLMIHDLSNSLSVYRQLEYLNLNSNQLKAIRYENFNFKSAPNSMTFSLTKQQLEGHASVNPSSSVGQHEQLNANNDQVARHYKQVIDKTINDELYSNNNNNEEIGFHLRELHLSDNKIDQLGAPSSLEPNFQDNDDDFAAQDESPATSSWWLSSSGTRNSNNSNQKKRFKQRELESLAPFLMLIKLERLNLAGNKLARLNRHTFLGLIHLKSLDLSRNLLEFVDKLAFVGLIELQELKLGHNKLVGHLGQLSLAFCRAPMQQLKSLELNDNSQNSNLISKDQSSVLPNQMFLCAPKLQDLRLDNLNLRYIQVNAFDNLHQLKRLNLSRNLMDQVPSDAMSYSRSNLTLSLRELDLSETLIEFVNANSMSSLRNLQILHMNSMPRLVSFDLAAFSLIVVPQVAEESRGMQMTSEQQQQQPPKSSQELDEFRSALKNLLPNHLFDRMQTPQSQSLPLPAPLTSNHFDVINHHRQDYASSRAPITQLINDQLVELHLRANGKLQSVHSSVSFRSEQPRGRILFTRLQLINLRFDVDLREFPLDDIIELPHQDDYTKIDLMYAGKFNCSSCQMSWLVELASAQNRKSSSGWNLVRFNPFQVPPSMPQNHDASRRARASLLSEASSIGCAYPVSLPLSELLNLEGTIGYGSPLLSHCSNKDLPAPPLPPVGPVFDQPEQPPVMSTVEPPNFSGPMHNQRPQNVPVETRPAEPQFPDLTLLAANSNYINQNVNKIEAPQEQQKEATVGSLVFGAFLSLLLMVMFVKLIFALLANRQRENYFKKLKFRPQFALKNPCNQQRRQQQDSPLESPICEFSSHSTTSGQSTATTASGAAPPQLPHNDRFSGAQVVQLYGNPLNIYEMAADDDVAGYAYCDGETMATQENHTTTRLANRRQPDSLSVANQKHLATGSLFSSTMKASNGICGPMQLQQQQQRAAEIERAHRVFSENFGRHTSTSKTSGRQKRGNLFSRIADRLGGSTLATTMTTNCNENQNHFAHHSRTTRPLPATGANHNFSLGGNFVDHLGDRQLVSRPPAPRMPAVVSAAAGCNLYTNSADFYDQLAFAGQVIEPAASGALGNSSAPNQSHHSEASGQDLCGKTQTAPRTCQVNFGQTLETGNVVDQLTREANFRSHEQNFSQEPTQTYNNNNNDKHIYVTLDGPIKSLAKSNFAAASSRVQNEYEQTAKLLLLANGEQLATSEAQMATATAMANNRRQPLNREEFASFQLAEADGRQRRHREPLEGQRQEQPRKRRDGQHKGAQSIGVARDTRECNATITGGNDSSDNDDRSADLSAGSGRRVADDSNLVSGNVTRAPDDHHQVFPPLGGQNNNSAASCSLAPLTTATMSLNAALHSAQSKGIPSSASPASGNGSRPPQSGKIDKRDRKYGDANHAASWLSGQPAGDYVINGLQRSSSSTTTNNNKHYDNSNQNSSRNSDSTNRRLANERKVQTKALLCAEVGVSLGSESKAAAIDGRDCQLGNHNNAAPQNVARRQLPSLPNGSESKAAASCDLIMIGQRDSLASNETPATWSSVQTESPKFCAIAAAAANGQLESADSSHSAASLLSHRSSLGACHSADSASANSSKQFAGPQTLASAGDSPNSPRAIANQTKTLGRRIKQQQQEKSNANEIYSNQFYYCRPSS